MYIIWQTKQFFYLDDSKEDKEDSREFIWNSLYSLVLPSIFANARTSKAKTLQI